jgi:hypothetical protein
MSDTEPRPPRAPTAVDDTRLARAVISQGGFSALREYLRRIREQHRARTGPFADLPSEQPEDVRRTIAAADTDEPLIDDVRGLRRASGQQGE